jgi:hypothetical protein
MMMGRERQPGMGREIIKSSCLSRQSTVEYVYGRKMEPISVTACTKPRMQDAVGSKQLRRISEDPHLCFSMSVFLTGTFFFL